MAIKCITFMQAILLIIVLEVIAMLIFEDSAFDMLSNVIVIGVGLWYVAGYVMDCKMVLAPQLA